MHKVEKIRIYYRSKAMARPIRLCHKIDEVM